MYGVPCYNVSNLVKFMEENLKKIAAVLFLSNQAVSLTELKKITELTELDQNSLENIFTELNNRLLTVGLILIRDTNRNNKNYEQQEIIIAVQKEMSEIAKKIRQNELEGDLTPAALQVITICAYLNGASSNEISFIRGVQSSQSIRTLSARGLIKNNNSKYFLTIECLQSLGISKIEELEEFEKTRQDFQERLNETKQESIQEPVAANA